MFSAKIENNKGNILTLTGREAVYQVIKIIGLNPPKAQINTTSSVGLDGAVFNSSKLETRNIVLTIKINGNVEKNRLQLYKYFRTKSWCKFYYTNDSRDVVIEGYVESVECDLFTNNELAQISIICPYPYFKSLAEIVDDSGNILPQFTFPFSINAGTPVIISTYDEDSTIDVYNASESETGTIIEIDVNSAFNNIQLKNTTTGDSFKLSYSFLAGDRIIINTNQGQKSIALLRNSAYQNLFSALQQGSVFFQLMQGENIFDYLVDGSAANNSAVFILFKHYTIYRGV